MSSQIFDWKKLGRHSLSVFGGIRLNPKQARRVNQRLDYHWQNDGRLQKLADNQILC